MKFFCFVIILCTFCTITLKAQEVFSTCGNTFENNNGMVSYSIGQTFYTYFSGNGSVTEGIQQTFEISEISSIPILIGEQKSIVCNVYPNPSYDRLTVHIEGNFNTVYSWRLSDNFGKLIKEDFIPENQTQIDLNKIGSGIFFLTILENNLCIKTLKIIKK